MKPGKQPREDAARQLTVEIKNLQSLSEWGADNLDRGAKGLAQQLSRQGDDLDTQIRRIMGAFRKVEANLAGKGSELTDELVRSQVLPLRPRLAYAAARKVRGRSHPLDPLYNVMSAAIDRVKTMSDFARLMNFMEAIVAYYKAFKEKVLS